jgi:hypothetical protein
MIRLAIALLLAMVPLGAGANELFVSPNGSDEGQCESNSPCATVSRACSVANSGADRATSIRVAGGVYENNTSCNIYYHRLVFLYGDCNDRPDIVLSGNDVAFWAQDSAILAVQCVGIRSSGTGSVAFASRQFAIMDVTNVRIGQLAGGTVMSAQEMSKINCLSGVVLYGSVGYVAQAGGMSTISLTCAFSFENTPQIDAIAVAVQKSLILASQASWVGALVGEKYICTDSQIDGATTIPGSDFSDCKITSVDAGKIRSEIDALAGKSRSEIDALVGKSRSEIDALAGKSRSEIDALAGKSRSEIDALAGKIDDIQHAENVQRRLDRLIAATVVLVLVLAASATYYRLATLKK